MKSSPERHAAFALSPIAYAVMLACCGGAAANPVGPSVAAGAAAFQANGKTLTVTNAPGTIINWQAFSIGNGELTRFNQQSASSAVLNRVVGNDGSKILGALTSNGRVFLVNPHGIVFGAGSRIDTAGFIASTLNITDSDFLQGKLKFEGGGHGILRNEGAIRAASDIVLVGPVIENAGLIRSESGAVLLAAGRSVTITSPNAQGVKFELQAPTHSALNLGTIEAAGAASMLAGTLRHSGDIRATSASVEGGRVVLSAQKEAIVDAGATVSANGAQGGSVRIQSGDLTSVAGRVEAMGSAGPGGTIHVLGNRVALSNGARVDASGETGGGTILVGGDYQGSNPDVQNAWRTFVGRDAQLRADAIASGDGGKVIVWADDTTRFYGSINARGGAQSGDGGFVETSGKGSLSVIGARVDTTAPAGRTGTWLLDPKFITVIAGGPAMPGMVDQFGDNAAGADAIDPASFSGSATNVVLQANTDIVFSSAVAMSGNGVGLTAQAGRSIVINANIGTTNGDIMLVANDPGAIAAQRDAGPATLNMAAGTLINAGTADVRLLTGPGVPGAASGDMTVANVTGSNVSIVHNGLTANSSIVRADAASLISATNSVHFEHTPTGAAASIGTDPAPMRIQTPRLEAHSAQANGAVGGIFIESPNGGDLEIGGVPATIYAGPIRGVQALAGGPITLSVTNGNLTRFAGTGAGCGPTGGTGGPICAVGAAGDITLRANALGGPGPAARLHVDASLGGSVSAEGTSFGGVNLERRSGDLLLSTYSLIVAGGQPIELATGNGILNVDNNIMAGPSPVTLFGGGPAGQIAFAGGTTVDALALTLGSTGNITFNSGTVTLNALVNATSPLSIGGATVNFAQVASGSTLGLSSGGANFALPSAFAGMLTLSGGTLGGPGSVTAANGFDFSGSGTIASGGNVVVFGGNTTISEGTPRITGTLNAGQLSMTGGTLTIDAGGVLTIPGINASTVSAATVNNAGMVNLAGSGDLNLDNGATFNNNSGGLFDIQTNAGIRHTAGSVPAFSNSGELRKSGGGVSGISIVGNPITFTNAPGGTINVQTGTLQISNGMPVNDGTIDISASATFSTNGGALTNSNTGTIGGSGTLDLGGATLVNNGTLRPGPAGGGAGTLAITGNLTQGATGRIDVQIAGTAADQTDLVAITGSAELAGTLNVSHFDGFNPPSDSSYTFMTYGSRVGSTDFGTKNFPAGYNYQSNINANDYTLALGAVVNQWRGPTGAGESGNWQDAPNWTLGHAPTVGEDALIPDRGSDGVISETITVSALNQAARKVTSFENITVGGGGSLNLGPTAGTVLLSAIDATLTVNGMLVLNGPIAVAYSITLGGGGSSIDVRTGTLPHLNLLPGGLITRSNGGNVTITGFFSASGGGSALSGALVTQGITGITGVVNPLNNWTNSGTFNVDGIGQVSASPGGGFVFTNLPSGTVNLNGNDPNPFSSGLMNAQILNTGTFHKRVGSAATQTIDTPFSNTGTGRIEVDWGTLVLPAMTLLPGAVPNTQSGTILIYPAATLSTGGSNLTNAAGGVIGGRGTLNLGGATLTNDGALEPSRILGGLGTGTLTIGGNLTQGAGGNIAVQLGGTGPGQFDVLSVTGSTTLAGTLNVSTTGGYVPTAGDSFTVIDAPAVAGTFGTITPTFPNTVTPSYAPASASLSIDAGPLNFWLPNASGDWDIAANWSLGVVPTAAHLARIDRPAAITVTVPAGAFGTERLRSEENVTIATGGALGLANASIVNGTLALNGGTLQGPGAVTVNGTLSLNAGTVASGPAGVTVNGTTSVSGGASQLTGRISTSDLSVASGSLGIGAAGALDLVGGGAKAISGGTTTVNNSGTINLAGTADLALNTGARLNNIGTLDIQTDADIVSTAGAGTLVNTGTLRKSAGAGVTIIANPVALTNSGTFDVLTGTLEFASANNTFNNGTQFRGPGSQLVTGNSTFNGTITSNGLTLQSGTFGGNARFEGTTAWTGGTMTGAFTVPAGATLNLSGGAAAGRTINGATAALTTNGMVNVSGTADTTLSDGALWDNFGALNLGGAARIVLAGDGAATLLNRGTGVITDTSTNASPITTAAAPKAGKAFSNAGTFDKNAGSAAVQTLDVPMTNTGTINVRSGTLVVNGFPINNGILDLEPGTTFSTGGAAFTNSPLGSITGNGTIAAPLFTNNGSLGPGDSPGRLTVSGNFVQGPSGTLVIELGGAIAGTTYDVLNVTGNASLDGALALFVTPGQTIGAGASFDFMTYGSRTGDFATVFPIPPGQTFQRAPGPTSYRVSATTPPVAVLNELSRIGQKDVLVLAERRPDNILVSNQQQLLTDEKKETLGECK